MEVSTCCGADRNFRLSEPTFVTQDEKAEALSNISRPVHARYFNVGTLSLFI